MDISEKDMLDHGQESEHFCNGGDSCCQNRPWHRCGIGEADFSRKIKTYWLFQERATVIRIRTAKGGWLDFSYH